MVERRQFVYIRPSKQMPDFRVIAAFLWCDGQDVDTDGNADYPASREWTELYISNRERPEESVTVDRALNEPLTLVVTSNIDYMAARVAYFLCRFTFGTVAVALEGPYRGCDALEDSLGREFDAVAALMRAHESPFSRATRENPYPD
jgi:hypothetical protein